MQQNVCVKKMTKQLTGKRGDTQIHSVVRSGNLELVLEIITCCNEAELIELLSKQNQSGENALYVAAESGDLVLVKELIKYYDIGLASIKARNGYDAFHVAAKQGDFGKCLVFFVFFFSNYSSRIFNLFGIEALYVAVVVLLWFFIMYEFFIYHKYVT